MTGGQQFADQDLKVFRDLLLWLWRSHEKPWEYEDPKASEIYADISRGYASIGKEEELEALLPTESSVRSEFHFANQYLYLNPIKDDSTLVPVLSMKSDFGRSIPELRLRLGLFLSITTKSTVTTKSSVLVLTRYGPLWPVMTHYEPFRNQSTFRIRATFRCNIRHGEKTKAFGYRFEAPEGPGEHHYYHAQIIHGFDKGQPFMGESSWLPSGCPAFPLDANDPVKLLLSLLIALYGVPYIAKIKPSVHGIEPYLNEMHCPKFGAFQWYFLVSIGTDHVRQEAHVTQDPEDFISGMRAKYQKCEIAGITKGRYMQLGRDRPEGKSRKK